MARNMVQDSLINGLDTRKMFRYDGYYIIDSCCLFHIVPNLGSGITNNRTYTVSAIGVTSKGIKRGLSPGTEVLDSVEVEKLLLELEQLNKLQVVLEAELPTLRLIYSDQSTESTVEANTSATVSGSEIGGKSDQ